MSLSKDKQGRSRLVNLVFSLVLFAVTSWAIVRWQESIRAVGKVSLTKAEQLTAAVGLCLFEAQNLFYFYYYLGYLPVTSSIQPSNFSTAGAEAFVKEHGSSLSNDLNGPCGLGRAGDWGKFLILLPHAWKTGSAGSPSVTDVTSLLFQFAIISVALSAFVLGRKILGLLIVITVGSYRFLIHEAYFNNNVFSISASLTLVLLALNLRFILPKSSRLSRYDWIIAATSGFLVALGGVVRGDIMPIVAALVPLYLVSGQRFGRTLALSGVFCFALLATRISFETYFDLKVREAHEFVRKSGGLIYTGGSLKHHPFWHPIATGLGDFGSDHGFVWEDLRTYKRVLPIMNSKFGLNLEINGYHFFRPGEPPHEWIKPELMPEYVESTREIVLAHIKEHPRWYLSILAKRLAVIRQHSSSLSITWPNGGITIPLSFWLFAPIIVACVFGRRLDYLKLVAFSLPTCFVSLFITSAEGTVNYSIIHLFVAAAAVDAALLLLMKTASYLVGFRICRFPFKAPSSTKPSRC